MSLTQQLLVTFKRDIASLRLIPSDGGRFEITADGVTIFSKLAEERFPEPEEVLEALRKHHASP